MPRKLKLILTLAIVVVTFAAFGWYLHKHPQLLAQLHNTSPALVLLLWLLYGGMQIALIGVLYASLLLYQKKMGPQENFLLNAYSALVNFFGPGQSGPGFRAVYLKVRYSVSVKQYIFATLLYYAIYALYSGLMLVAASRPWWQTLLVVILIAGVCWLVVTGFLRRNSRLLPKNLSKKTLARILLILGLATLLQVACTFLIYWAELRSLDDSITWHQALAYTGAANFSLFVALTPGAIGIREAFLVFSQRLHHIPNSLIVAANVLDRAVYILFLGILFVVVLLLHAGNKLQPKKIQAEAEAAVK